MKPANVTGYAGLTRMICPRLAIALLALGAVPTSLTSSLAQLPTNTVVATIPVGSGPGWTVVSPDSSTVYVINDTDGTVSVINASTNTVTSVITVGSLPAQGGISPDGKTLYVLNEAADNVAIISTASNTVTGTFKIGKHGDGLAVSPDGKELYLGRAYVFRNGKGTIKSVDTTTNKITSTVVLGALDPLTVLFRPDGSSAYISAANEFGKNNRFPQKLIQIDTATHMIVSTTGLKAVENNVGYAYMAINPAGTVLYVDQLNEILVVDTSDKKVSATISLPGSASQGAVTPDGQYFYVPIYSTTPGTVVTISTATNQVVGTPVTVGNEPGVVAIAPDGNYAYVTNSQDNTVTVISISPP